MFVERLLCAHLPNSGASCEDDGNPCTDDVCVGATCSHQPSSGQPCDSDGDPCTDDVCVNGTCSHEPISGPPCESDGNPCTNDVCENGACAHVPLTGPTCADDGNVCTFDVCENGTCTHPAHDGVACADDGNPCTGDVCSGGSCTHPGISGPACDDGDSCTEEDTCVNGTCVGTEYRDCDDQNPCTDDDCVGEGCVHTNNTAPCEDGNACTEDDTCAGGTCQAGTPIDCDDGNLCSTELGCDPDEGCLYDWDNCDDGDPCTIDDCDPETGQCEHTEMWPDDADCYLGGETWTIIPGMPPGGWVFLNNDDDDGHGIADRFDHGVSGENDLVPVSLTISAGGPFTGCNCYPDDFSLYTWWLGAGWFYGDPEGYEWLLGSQPLPAPSVIYVHGWQYTDACGVPSLFRVYCPCGCHWCGVWTEPIRVIRVASLEWQKAAEDSLDLDDCENNEGKRIFPGKLSPDDESASTRRQVKLVATIAPPIGGVTVYFEVLILCLTPVGKFGICKGLRGPRKETRNA